VYSPLAGLGDVDAGKSIAGLYTLVSCEARGINPFAYLADVIPRVNAGSTSCCPAHGARSRQRVAHIADQRLLIIQVRVTSCALASCSTRYGGPRVPATSTKSRAPKTRRSISM
jgi:hypothetical protein